MLRVEAAHCWKDRRSTNPSYFSYVRGCSRIYFDDGRCPAV